MKTKSDLTYPDSFTYLGVQMELQAHEEHCSEKFPEGQWRQQISPNKLRQWGL
jgi:hypothetical protein